MARRLAVQLGFAIVALGLASGAALADNSSPTSPNSGDSQQSNQSLVALQTNSDGNIQLQTTAVSQQQVGGSGGQSSGGDDTTSGSGGSGGETVVPSATGPSVGSGGTAIASGPDDATMDGQGSVSSTATGLGGSQPASATPAGTSGHGSGGSSLTGGGNATGSTGSGPGGSIGSGPLLVSWHQALARIAAEPNPPVIQAAATAGVPQSPATPGGPPPAHTPTGLFLSQLPLLLQQLVVPAAQAAPAAPATPRSIAIMLVVFGLAALAGVRRRPGGSLYTARLRHSGFLGAARSDVGAAHHFFATPREMGCIFASAT